jgi:NAD(P)H dehydrogenase (quinone)
VVTVAIVVHSEYGHTWRQAQAVCDGVRAAGADVQVVRIDEAAPTRATGTKAPSLRRASTIITSH